jgi:hypothetical protein
MHMSHFALANGTQQNCLGGAGIFTAPTMAGPCCTKSRGMFQLVLLLLTRAFAAAAAAAAAVGATCEAPTLPCHRPRYIYYLNV